MKITIEFDSMEEMLNFHKNGFDPAPKEICDISLRDLLPAHEDGCNRAKNCLESQAIYTVNDLIKFTEVELLRTPNLGRRSLRIIIDKLAAHGLRLKSCEN